MCYKHRTIICLLILLFSGLQIITAQNTLRERFLSPPKEAKPWTFWYWMFGALSEEALTADLEAMKQAGLGGAYLMPIKSPEQGPGYPGAVDQLSSGWWKMVHHSFKEADRLGLKLGMHICDGFALAGGPWISPEESMQKVVWADTVVSGRKIKELTLPHPQAFHGYYEDIALFAYRLPESIASQKERSNLPVITASALIDTAGGFFRGNADKIPSPASDDAWIQYTYAEPYTCRNIEIVLDGTNYQAQRFKVMASDDGKNFRLVKQLQPARRGWQDGDYNSTYSIPPTTARYFRFCWNPAGSEPGTEDMDAAKWKPNLKVKQILLHSEPRIDQWEGKAGLIWRLAPRTSAKDVSTDACIKKDSILNLTHSMKNGVLTVTLPKGKWKLLRMGHTSTGHTNATAGGGKGLECDKFSVAAVRKQFDNWFSMMFAQTDPVLAHRVLKYMHVDSWECGSQNWSPAFAEEFKARRGYDLMPYLPLLAGIPIDNVEASENVLLDVRTTIAELVVDVFYKVLADCAKAYGCEFSAECVAPTMVSDGLMHYKKVDRPMGEFWLNSPTHDKLNDILDAVSGAHIYGKNIVQAEGFTQIRGTWNEHPGMLKSLLDRNYALGINKLFFHVYVHNPYMDRRPGMTLDGIGLFFQRDQTWWKYGAKAFVDYAARCQALLQYGHPVVDIAVFTGEEIPRRSILPERLVPSLPGLFGAERVASERKRLANEGQPLRTIVKVTHSANMAVPEKWVDPLRGYAYDSFNRDALLNLAKAENGQLVLPGGASYKVLVLPLPRPMNPDGRPLSAEVQAKIEELKRGGVVVPSLPYTADDFSAYNLQRDVIVPANVAWTHRRGADADIYFIANQTEKPVAFDASLRISGKQPQLWNPLNGEITLPEAWTEKDGRTVVPLSLEANGSVFIVLPHHGTLAQSKPDKVKPAVLPLPVKQWEVFFPAIHKTVARTSLFDWSKEEDEQLKYYSGTAVYKASFRWKGKAKGRIFLSLGEIDNVANVRVNGMDCGTVWTTPYQVELTKALKKGTNEIEIEVANTWANAIRGADKGKAPFEGIWANARFRMDEDILLPAGLLGPLEIVIK